MNPNGVKVTGERLTQNSRPRFFLDYGRSPHVRARARGQTTPLRYIRIKMAKITRIEQKGLKKIKKFQVKEFV